MNGPDRRTIALIALFTLFGLSFSPGLLAQEPEPDTESALKAFLTKMAGDWDSKSEFEMAPGGTGAESSRMVGRWLVSEMHMHGPGGQTVMTGILTVGYDGQKDTIVGTWIDSMQNLMWHYEGTLEGNVLTLSARGPNPQMEGGVANYRDIYEIQDDGHKVMKSEVESADGEWVRYGTINLTRRQ